MKTQVWKYPFTNSTGRQTFDMPQLAVPLCFDKQRDSFCLWARVDPEAPLRPRVFAICGTGHTIDDGAKYVGSTQDGPFVWHLFEEQP